MAKVSITIDDANPALVTAFGESSLNTIAGQFGYMEMVEKTPEELPKKVEVQTIDGENNPITVMQYPEGTEMYKPNPETRSAFVGRKMLENEIVPALIRGFADRKRHEANVIIDQEIAQAKEILKSVAVIETV